jgi:hypothetical protein
MGDYRTAIINGLVMSHWWFNVMSSSYEDALVATILLAGFAMAASQVENLSLHLRATRLMEAVVGRNQGCLEAQRLFQDSKAQYIYNCHPNDRNHLKKALDIHTNEVDLADGIISLRHEPILTADGWYSIAETYQNRLTLMRRLRLPNEEIISEMERLEDRVKEVETIIQQLCPDPQAAEHGADFECYRKLARIEYYLDAGLNERAMEFGTELLGDLSRRAVCGPFVIGKAHLLMAKI